MNDMELMKVTDMFTDSIKDFKKKKLKAKVRSKLEDMQEMKREDAIKAFNKEAPVLALDLHSAGVDSKTVDKIVNSFAPKSNATTFDKLRVQDALQRHSGNSSKAISDIRAQKINDKIKQETKMIPIKAKGARERALALTGTHKVGQGFIDKMDAMDASTDKLDSLLARSDKYVTLKHNIPGYETGRALVDEGYKEFLTDFNAYFQKGKHELTGAQASEKEFGWIMKSLPNMNMQPESFKRVAKRLKVLKRITKGRMIINAKKASRNTKGYDDVLADSQAAVDEFNAMLKEDGADFQTSLTAKPRNPNANNFDAMDERSIIKRQKEIIKSETFKLLLDDKKYNRKSN